MRQTLLAPSLIAVLLSGPALAQRSLFDQPVQNAPQVAPAPAAPAPAAPAAPAQVPAVPLPAAAPPVARTTSAPQPAQAAPDQAEEAPARPRRQARPRKPSGPSPARSLAVFNGSPDTLTSLEVSQDGQAGRLRRALAPGKRTRLSLPAFKACEVNVTASFQGQAAGTPIPVDICQEKSLNFRP